MIPPPRVIWMYYTLHKTELQTPLGSRKRRLFLDTAKKVANGN